jgi:hypothetical protein
MIDTMDASAAAAFLECEPGGNVVEALPLDTGGSYIKRAEVPFYLPVATRSLFFAGTAPYCRGLKPVGQRVWAS